MNSPLLYVGFLGATIDLSRLVMLGKAEFVNRMGHGGHYVGFKYRYYGDDKDSFWEREVENTYVYIPRVDPHAFVPDTTLPHGGYRKEDFRLTEEEMESLRGGEECYVTGRLRPGVRSGYHLTYIAPDGRSVAEYNLQRQLDELTSLWWKWKVVEPEIYALIRKHLS